MSIEVSERWIPTDPDLYLIFNHTDVRETTKVFIENGVHYEETNEITTNGDPNLSGYHTLYHDLPYR